VALNRIFRKTPSIGKNEKSANPIINADHDEAYLFERYWAFNCAILHGSAVLANRIYCLKRGVVV